ncbi:MAG: hypothetical protein HKM04_01180 [Legionellales bacterium]|nr:hypothetical protein [Legionellales bacterium]
MLNGNIPFIDLTQIDDEIIQKHVSAGLTEWCLKHVNERNLIKYINTLVQLIQQSEAQKNNKYLMQSMGYIMYNMDDDAWEVFKPRGVGHALFAIDLT